MLKALNFDYRINIHNAVSWKPTSENDERRPLGSLGDRVRHVTSALGFQLITRPYLFETIVRVPSFTCSKVLQDSEASELSKVQCQRRLLVLSY